MTRSEKEANLFRFFLKLEPLFVGEPIKPSWEVIKKDPPDILCHTVSGKAVGVELKSWIDKAQMNSRKLRERIESDILDVLEKPDTRPHHFRLVWLYPHEKTRIREIGAVRFRNEFFDLIEKADADWPQQKEFESGLSVRIDPTTHPVVAKALHSIRCFPRRDNDDITPGTPWIKFPAWGGPFSYEMMMAALIERLSAAREKYRSNDALRSLAEVVLLVHYDQALLYNTPAFALGPAYDKTLADIVANALTFLNGDSGAFSRIFLLIALEPGGRAFQLFP